MSFLQRQIYAIGLFLFLIPVVIFVISTLLLFLKFPVLGIIYPVSIILAGILVYQLEIKNEKERSLNRFLFILLGGGLTFISLWLSGLFYDVSFDGQWYHQDAIIFLSEGWNPFHDDFIANASVSGNNANYVNHYPKATWIYQSVVYLFFGGIELGKSLHLQLIFSFGLLLFAYLSRRTKLSLFHRCLITLLTIVSPITLGQIFSFYVDGILYCFLGINLLFLLDRYVHRNGRLLWVFLSFIFLINIKFTGLVYALLFALGCIGYATWHERKALFNMAFHFVIMILIGVFLFGYPTYGRNIIEKNHVFYPIMGKNNEGLKIAQAQYPKDFINLNRFQKFLRAHAAIPNYTAETHPSVEKKQLFNPTFIRSTIPYFENHQPVTMSPFGPFELELWLLFGISLVLFFVNVRRYSIYLLLLLILFSMIIQPEFWNLRYAPQLLWLIVIIQATLLTIPSKMVQGFSVVFCILFIINGLIASKENWCWVAKRNAKLKAKLTELSMKKTSIYPGWMSSFKLKLKDFNLSPSPQTNQDIGAQEIYPGDFSGWKYKMISE